MLKLGLLADAFQTYWNDVEKCRAAKAYWSLLHVTVCLPDICAALQSANGETTEKRYAAWCDDWLKEPLLSGSERYGIRCKVLHQGRASGRKSGRYSAYAFGQPSSDGHVDHMRLESGTLHLDVGELATQTRQAVDNWIEWLEANPSSPRACNVMKYLPSLVHVCRTAVWEPAQAGSGLQVYIYNKTN
jgi:hypothetical protein